MARVEAQGGRRGAILKDLQVVTVWEFKKLLSGDRPVGWHWAKSLKKCPGFTQ